METRMFKSQGIFFRERPPVLKQHELTVLVFLVALDGQDRQSPIASVQRTLSTLTGRSSIPRGMDVK